MESLSRQVLFIKRLTTTSGKCTENRHGASVLQAALTDPGMYLLQTIVALLVHYLLRKFPSGGSPSKVRVGQTLFGWYFHGRLVTTGKFLWQRGSCAV